jgi:hypothetical protein
MAEPCYWSPVSVYYWSPVSVYYSSLPVLKGSRRLGSCRGRENRSPTSSSSSTAGATPGPDPGAEAASDSGRSWPVAACCSLLRPGAACCGLVQPVAACCSLLQPVAASFSGQIAVGDVLCEVDGVSMLRPVAACCSLLQRRRAGQSAGPSGAAASSRGSAGLLQCQ